MSGMFYLLIINCVILLFCLIILIAVFTGHRDRSGEVIRYMSDEFRTSRSELSSSIRDMQAGNERSLSHSFDTVTRQLMAVQKGLGEMQTLASDVGSLKKVLSNVKTRGILGEYQLANILEEVLSPEQYEVNVRTKRMSDDPVEFAVRLPGAGDEPVLLPIDAKFPTEDYQRLNDAYEQGDRAAVERQRRNLERALLLNARKIRDKYVEPPFTTDFAVMFLPFEGLYAEALRCPGLFERIQREYNITMTGPSTLTAFLNSLQIGFRTLAIGRQTSRIRELMAAVKTEFIRFGASIEAVQKNLQNASSNLEKVSGSAKRMEKKLDDTALEIEE